MKLNRLLIMGAVWAGALTAAGPLRSHHEAIFGPQSAALITKKRYVSAQYYMTNEGRRPSPQLRSHIGVMSVGTRIGRKWGVSATLPIEAERGEQEAATGVQDLVVGVRYFALQDHDRSLMTVLTLEPPTGNLEHRALGVGGGAVYTRERGSWSAIGYGLGRTENSFEEGEKRGNRLFLGAGVAYENNRLPFGPQIGVSVEHTGRQREAGILIPESNSEVVMLHPTLTKTFGDSLQTFFVVSLPVAQWSGSEGWQRTRVAAGMVWSF